MYPGAKQSKSASFFEMKNDQCALFKKLYLFHIDTAKMCKQKKAVKKYSVTCHWFFEQQQWGREEIKNHESRTKKESGGFRSAIGNSA